MTRTLALLDWDNTLRPGFTILEWSTWLARRRLFEPAKLTELTDVLGGYRAGRVSYRELSALAPEIYAAGLRGVRAAEVDEVATAFVEADRAVLFSFAEPLLAFLAAHGIETCVVSGAPLEVLAAYQRKFRWATTFGVSVGVADEVYTATLTANPAGTEAKAAIVRQLAAEHRVLLAFGDSESDLPLLAAAANKVVVDSVGIIPDSARVLRIKSTISAAELIQP